MFTANKKPLGMRVIKTAIAVVLSITISKLIFDDAPGFAGYAAIVAMTSNVPASVPISINRLLATLVAAVLGLIFQLNNLVNPISFFIGIILVIEICIRLNWKNSIILGCMYFISMMLFEGDSSEVIYYAWLRLADTTIGLLVGVLVNMTIAKPKSEKFIYEAYLKLYEQSICEFKNLLVGNDISQDDLLVSITNVNNLYEHLLRERRLYITRKNDKIYFKGINQELTSLATNIIDLSYYKKTELDQDVKALLRQDHLYVELPVHGDLISSIEEKIVYNYEVKKILILFESLSDELRYVQNTLISQGIKVEEKIEDIERDRADFSPIKHK